MSRKVRSPLLKQIMAQADVSSILKQPGDPLPEDLEEDSFNPPLHSTAVYTDADSDEHLPTRENPKQISAKLMSPIRPVIREKRTPSRKESKSNPVGDIEHSARRPDTAQTKRTPQKKSQDVPKRGSSKMHGPPRNLADGAPPSTQAPNANVTPEKKSQDVPKPGSSKMHEPPRNLADGAPSSTQVSAKKTRTPRKEKNVSSKKKSRKDRMETNPADIGSPENVPKSVRNVNELDVVLLECEKHTELYRENVDTDVCKRAVDVFFNSFKEQLSTTISDLQKLKNLKRRNAKMQLEIGRKRKRLLEVKDEIIANQPKLNKLQKECSELEQKQESLKSARTILDNIAQLQEDYMRLKTKNPHLKETYGISSLPALCLQVESVLNAEQHFHIVNRKLQSFIDPKKGND
ncbi:centromere protein U isoform X2 [Eleutherodactylus coqui]